LKIYVTASSNQQSPEGCLPLLGSDVQRRGPIMILKVNVAAIFNQLFHDGLEQELKGLNRNWRA
jgi:hypothetical protein